MLLDHCPVCGGPGKSSVVRLEDELEDGVTISVLADGWKCDQCQEEIFDDAYVQKLTKVARQAKETLHDDEILTAHELAQYLRTSENVVYAMANAGEIPGLKVGRSWRFKRMEIDKLLAHRREHAAAREPA